MFTKKTGPQVITLWSWWIRRRPIFPGRYQPSIVGTEELNCCVRDGNRCDLFVISTGSGEGYLLNAPSRLHKGKIESNFWDRKTWSARNNIWYQVYKLNCRKPKNLWSSPRPVSTGQLHTLLHFHFRPIDQVVYLGSYHYCGKSHLEVGFTLRCFQRLSLPDLATQLCHWRDNWYTIGLSIPVLSY